MVKTAKAVKAQSVFSGDKISIITDHRERRTKTCEWLRTFDARIIEKQLEVADYIVSDRVGIERKTVNDLLQSVLNQRLFRQLEELSASFDRPLLILEGDQRMLFSIRNIHPNTIHGVLSSITLDYGIPIIWTHAPKVTAAQIYWTACREQGKGKRGLQTRVCKKTRNTPQLQEFLVAGLPSVNSVLSKRLLQEFKTVKNVFSMSEQELQKVAGLGKKKAKSICRLLNSEYGERD
jgi:Fanconi anemia group M protein